MGSHLLPSKSFMMFSWTEGLLFLSDTSKTGKHHLLVEAAVPEHGHDRLGHF